MKLIDAVFVCHIIELGLLYKLLTLHDISLVLSNMLAEPTHLPAVNDEWTSYRSVEAVHLTAEGKERVGVLRGALVRPAREVKLTNTPLIARLLQDGRDTTTSFRLQGC